MISEVIAMPLQSMRRPTTPGKKHHRGFTLMELLVVLLLIALLASLVTPVVTNSIERAKESATKENLLVLRKAIDDYYSDKGHYPETLEVLVENKYIRKVPKDPFTEKSDTWEKITKDDVNGKFGITDIRSSKTGVASDGTNYKDW